MTITPSDMTTLNAQLDRTTRISISVTPTTSDGKSGSSVEIGLIQSIDPTESREVTAHWTLGGNAELPNVLVPGLVNGRSLSIKALALFKAPIIGQLSSDPSQFIYSLVQQQYPFTITVAKEKADKSATYSINYNNCFITQWSYSQDISRGSNVEIVESATVVYQNVTAA